MGKKGKSLLINTISVFHNTQIMHSIKICPWHWAKIALFNGIILDKNSIKKRNNLQAVNALKIKKLHFYPFSKTFHKLTVCSAVFPGKFTRLLKSRSRKFFS